MNGETLYGHGTLFNTSSTDDDDKSILKRWILWMRETQRKKQNETH